MFQRGRGSRHQRCSVGAEHQPAGEIDVAAQRRTDDALDSQFLAKLALERCVLGLPRLHLAAGQFPAAGQFRRTGTLREQQTTAVDQRGCDNHSGGGTGHATIFL